MKVFSKNEKVVRHPAKEVDRFFSIISEHLILLISLLSSTLGYWFLL